MSNSQLLPLSRGADLAGCTYHALRAAVLRGELRATRIGERYFVLPSEVRRWQAGRRKRTRFPSLATATAPAPAPTTTLSGPVGKEIA